MLARQRSIQFLSCLSRGTPASSLRVLRSSRTGNTAAQQLPLLEKTSVRMSSHSGIKVVETSKAMPVAGPYNQAIIAGNTIYVSGQIPADKNMNLIEGNIAAKTRACGKNIQAILEEAGSNISKVVKCTVYLDDMANFAEMNAEYEKIFPHKPARTTIAVKALPKGVPVEIECIALA